MISQQLPTSGATPTYREVADGMRVCRYCDQEVKPLKPRTQLDYRMPLRARAHKVNGERCPGSHEDVLSWLEASRLPGWDDLSDLDKGAALMHAWKIHWEKSALYAREHYPARYRDHEALVGLEPRIASRHAACVVGSWTQVNNRLGTDEVDRLYQLALVEHEWERGIL